jgi:hypothetical protein
MGLTLRLNQPADRVRAHKPPPPQSESLKPAIGNHGVN